MSFNRTLNTLPAEIVPIITRHLDAVDMASLSRTCRWLYMSCVFPLMIEEQSAHAMPYTIEGFDKFHELAQEDKKRRDRVYKLRLQIERLKPTFDFGNPEDDDYEDLFAFPQICQFSDDLEASFTNCTEFEVQFNEHVFDIDYSNPRILFVLLSVLCDAQIKPTVLDLYRFKQKYQGGMYRRMIPAPDPNHSFPDGMEKMWDKLTILKVEEPDEPVAQTYLSVVLEEIMTNAPQLEFFQYNGRFSVPASPWEPSIRLFAKFALYMHEEMLLKNLILTNMRIRYADLKEFLNRGGSKLEAVIVKGVLLDGGKWHGMFEHMRTTSPNLKALEAVCWAGFRYFSIDLIRVKADDDIYEEAIEAARKVDA
ncbi:hypothetical protein BO71DRAFT_411829 [Aspergillus ellipticus CBS 707.79]|uniref:F-box domain-containing protein n=1 Tax=Aspergillus ellipticus CBS 707.79 TaxID=1448320 RepID=A0A319D2E1_9EURO|nr:hypothetical protein BO71DRAFT_411829 [Aspergillus ellipticus CBS 707.79]